MKQATLLFLLKDDQILLAMKKRGLGEGKWNGVGGKVEPGETIEEAVIRETEEEIGVLPTEVDKVAEFDFTYMHVSVFISKSWKGEPVETEEMAPKWFALEDIPYAQMWDDDKTWLPQVLNGSKLTGRFVFDENGMVVEHELTHVDQRFLAE